MSYIGRAGAKLHLMPAHDDVSSMSGLSLSSQSDVERDRQAKKCKRQVTFNGNKSNSSKDRYNDRRGLQSCLVTRVKNRLPAGAGDQLTEVPSECSKAAPGIDYLLTPHAEVNFSEVRMSDSVPLNTRPINKCSYFPKFEDTRKVKTVGTQTLYRESSAQTMPYLPDIQDRERDETLELFNLSTLLAGDKPPGLYEVEILERARKRWAFTKSLKIQLKQKFREAREQTYKSKYRSVIEAFEWEKWIEREEYIQECQMMRLEFVIRMFDKREQEMQLASKTRIEMACEKIEARRTATLHKNEVEYHRAMRRLQNKYNNVKHSWRKQRITYELGSPCSEFYAPLVRHGVDPGRRHFTGGRKAFDMRIDELEKKVDINKLTCPFSKLKKWSQPKEPTKEYEQNFCTDSNLQKLYETLRTLRTQATKHKQAPKCLIRRQQLDNLASVEKKEDTREVIADAVEPPPITYTSEQLNSIEKRETILKEQVFQVDRSKMFLAERRNEDFENMLAAYEGTTIGWIMQFLSEEMERLQEQRKLHFFSILAQKERWRREAAEAGLRQKENDMRYIYEELFQLTDAANVNVCNEYLDGILSTDMAHNADCDATISIESLAMQIDQDLHRWLESFQLIQTPLNFEPLRYMLRDLVFPDLNDILYKQEKTLIVKYIIDEVLFSRIDALLDPYDVATTIADDLIDRLIDNDLYYFSTEDESEHTGDPVSHYEVEAILRKLIRQSVPGRRWRTEDERICDENVKDIFDDIFDLIANRQAKASVCSPFDPVDVHETQSKFTIDAESKSDDIERRNRESLPQGNSELLRMRVLSLLKRMKVDKITKPLFNEEIFIDDGFKDNDDDELLRTETYRSKSVVMADMVTQVPVVYNIPSTLNIQEIKNFREFIEFKRQEKKQYQMRTSSILSDIGITFEKCKRTEPEENDSETQTCQKDVLLGILEDLLPSEEGIVEEDNSHNGISEEHQEEDREHLRRSVSWDRRLTGVIPAIMAHQDDEARSSLDLTDKRDQSVKYAKLEDLKQRRRTWPSEIPSLILSDVPPTPQPEAPIDIADENKTLQPIGSNELIDLYVSAENLLFKAVPIKSKLSLASITSGTKVVDSVKSSFAELDKSETPSTVLPLLTDIAEKDGSEAPVAKVSIIESPSGEAPDAKISAVGLLSPESTAIEPTSAEIAATEISTMELPAHEASTAKIAPDDLPSPEATTIEPLPAEVPNQEVPTTEIPRDDLPSPEATAIEPSNLEVPTQETPAAETSPVDLLPQEIPAVDLLAEEATAIEPKFVEVPAQQVSATEISTIELPAQDDADDLPPPEATVIEPLALEVLNPEAPTTEISPDDLPSPEAATAEPSPVEVSAQPVADTEISTIELPAQETPAAEI